MNTISPTPSLNSVSSARENVFSGQADMPGQIAPIPDTTPFRVGGTPNESGYRPPLRFKLSKKTILAGVVALLMIVGTLAAAYSVRMNQDIRQQADCNPYFDPNCANTSTSVDSSLLMPAGGTCSSGMQCSSGVCVNGKCQSQDTSSGSTGGVGSYDSVKDRLQKTPQQETQTFNEPAKILNPPSTR